MSTRRQTAQILSGTLVLVSAATLTLHAQLRTDDFGPFTMDFVTIGNPVNLPDTSPAGWGAVATTYLMGKYEVSEDMIAKANTLGNLRITKDTRGVDRPATSVSWNEAARFVNWLNTSKGYSPAYKFSLQPGDGGYTANADILLWASGDAGYNPANPYRNANAVYFLPSENEWYKAAYFDGTTYFNYPTGSDSAPTPTSGSTIPGQAVYNGQPGPADIANAGGLSPYETMGQRGKVWEWMESAYDGGNSAPGEARGLRGGYWNNTAVDLASSYRMSIVPAGEDGVLGFRVAAVPEPMEAGGVIGLAALGFAVWRRRGSR